MDDVTLEAHRGQADCCESGKPDGERNVDQSVNFDVTRNTYSAHSKFSENTRTEKLSMDQGNLMSETVRAHRLGLYLKSRDR